MKTTTHTNTTMAVALFTAIVLPMMFSPFLAAAEVVGVTATSGTGNGTTAVPPIAKIELVTVGPKLKDCTGVSGPAQCMVVNDQYYHGKINDFNYEEGYNYELYVIKTERDNVPADESKYVYNLVRIKSKTPAISYSISNIENNKVMKEIMQELNAIIGSYIQIGEWHHEHGSMTFSENRFSTTAGCNAITGEYTRDGLNISFDKIISTRKMCIDSDVMVAENDLIKTLTGINSFSMVPGGIVLNGTNGSLNLTR